uniref:UDP-glycosyltransferases domain-containing protein n=1 Tax=Leersia perrieri TaxID=77586 RepID=A0A0D9WIW1_9ORYZ
MTTKKTMVLYPGLAVSHFLPMMQLADELLKHGYDVTVALIDSAFQQLINFPATVDRVASSKPTIRFHRLPRAKQSLSTITNDGDFLFLAYLDLVSRHNDCLHDFLSSMAPPGGVHALVVDSLFVEALDVAKRLNVPGYVFHAWNAGVFAIYLQLYLTRAEGQSSFRELGDTPLELPGLPPMPASHLIAEMLEDPESEVYKAIMDLFRRNIEYSNGFLGNTFESLEACVVNALKDGSPALPPFYCIGPLVEKRTTAERHECLAWLDRQPDRSVVFLCFGSTGMASHSVEQLREIAVGLEKSNQRFLWVVRAPIDSDDPEKEYDPSAEPDLDAVLPDGFLQRTSGRGIVVKLWAPQVDVLRHRATGAFGLVTAEKVEAKVRLVIESEVGRELRMRVTAHMEAAAVAWADDGKSRSWTTYGYAVTVALINPAFQQQINFPATVDRVVSSKPSIRFHKLPRVELSPATAADDDGDVFLLGYLDLVRRHNECLHDFLRSMPPDGIHALVMDSLSVVALDVAKRLDIPSFVFHSGNAGAFAIYLQLSSIHAEGDPSFGELGDTPLEIPGPPSMPASHIFDELLTHPESEVYKAVIDVSRRNAQNSNGVLVNTFESSEARVVNVLADRALPLFYCVGPFVEKAGERGHECLTWLHRQLERSVVFLCFGSTGAGNHSMEQLNEIAVGQRFLWVVRALPPLVAINDTQNLFDPCADPDLNALLPSGFLSRTSGRGIVVKLWAPQVDVLRHRVIGIEDEQVLMVEEMGVAVELVGSRVAAGACHGRGSGEEGEVGHGIRDRQCELRALITSLKEAVAVAWAIGGPSHLAFARMKTNNVVLYPCTAVGHLTPMMELAKVFLEHGYTVTVALLDDPLNPPVMSSNIEHVVASHPSVSFHWLHGAATFSVASDEHFLVRYFNLIRHNNEQLRRLLCSVLVPQAVHAIVIDVLCNQAIDVPRGLGIPAYGFFCSGASALAIYLQLPSLHAKSNASFGELGDTPLELLGVPPLPASHVPEHLLPHRESKIYKKYIDMCKKAPEFDGIVVNTFESLESRAVEALGDSTGFPPGCVLPPVYFVGPLVKRSGGSVSTEKHHCIAWLDGQPN